MLDAIVQAQRDLKRAARLAREGKLVEVGAKLGNAQSQIKQAQNWVGTCLTAQKVVDMPVK